MKVFVWQGYRQEAPGHKQTREIVAVKSKNAVARIAGGKPFNLGETRNREEIELALSLPGTIFWRPLDESGPWNQG